MIHPLLRQIPKEQIDEVFNSKVDIDFEFIGFTDIYEALSKIIPKHWTIVDLGCAYNPQCFYFKNHKAYLAIDIPDFTIKRFKTENCQILEMTIQNFIVSPEFENLDLRETFAICSYVPDDSARNLARQKFPNLYVYYPCGTYVSQT